MQNIRTMYYYHHIILGDRGNRLLFVLKTYDKVIEKIKVDNIPNAIMQPPHYSMKFV